VPPHRKSIYYDLIIDGKKYPPKCIISLACRYLNGREWPPSEFNAVEARDYFRHRGYTVIDRRNEADQLIKPEDDESQFPEGRARFRVHRELERDGTIPRKTKALRLAETGKLECEVCGFSFAEKYGLLGEGFIEAHHKIPVSKLTGEEITRTSDLALVCCNCHRMLHRGSELLDVDDLRQIVDENSD
jgi:predicted HNH restriction endonuclease